MSNSHTSPPFNTVKSFDPTNPAEAIDLIVEEADAAELVDGPAHHLWDMLNLVPHVVGKRDCVAVFSGLRRDGALASGRAYCGVPSCAYRNNGESVPPHQGMCFVVFVDRRGAIFDWDWMPADPHGLPTGWEERFAEPLWISLRELERSETVDDGRRRMSFPRPEDYQRCIGPALQLASLAELRRFPHLVVQVQADWHRHGQSGCHFAVALNAARRTYGWRTDVVPESTLDDAITRMAAITTEGIACAETRIVSFLLPWVRAEHQLVEVTNKLARVPGWAVTPSRLDEHHTNLAVHLLLEGGTVRSWVLGLGPFPFLPRTRRAPFTEIVVPVKPKIPGQHRMDTKPEGLMRSHLADVPMPILDDAKFRGLEAETKRHRTFVLAGDDLRAKAKVTFTVPTAAWEAAAR